MNYLVNCVDKVPDLHLINTLSSYALSIFNMRSKHTCHIVVLVVYCFQPEGVQGGSTINNIRHL